MVCHFCDNWVPSVEDAIAHDWVPCYWSALHNEEVARPVCAACCQSALEWDDEYGGYFVRLPTCP